MAAGDFLGTYAVDPTSVSDGSFLDLVADTGEEIIVHNIYVPEGTAVELYWHGPSGDIKFDSDTQGFASFQFHGTETIYVRVKNVSGSSADLAADGVRMESP